MRIILIFIALTGCVHAGQSVKVFDSTLSLDNQCELVSEIDGTINNYNMGFKEPKNCRIITHQNTSAENIVFINGGYIAFIENNHDDLSTCYSEYTAIKIGKDNNITISPLIKKSGSCFQGKEIKDFEYFSSKFRH